MSSNEGTLLGDVSKRKVGSLWTQAELDELYQICMEYEGCEDFYDNVRRELDAVGIVKTLSQVREPLNKFANQPRVMPNMKVVQ